MNFQCKKCGPIGKAVMNLGIDGKPVGTFCFKCFANLLIKEIGTVEPIIEIKPGNNATTKE